MYRFLYNFLIFIFTFLALIFIISIFWHSVAFKYLFQFCTSLGFMGIGFYYFIRTNTEHNVQIGLFFIVLSPIFFLISEIVFFVGLSHLHVGTFNLPKPYLFSFFSNILHKCLNSKINFGPSLQIPSLWFYLVLFLIANAITLKRNPKIRIMIAVNLLTFACCVMLFHIK